MPDRMSSYDVIFGEDECMSDEWSLTAALHMHGCVRSLRPSSEQGGQYTMHKAPLAYICTPTTNGLHDEMIARFAERRRKTRVDRCCRSKSDAPIRLYWSTRL